jgi:hypothetical protein
MRCRPGANKRRKSPDLRHPGGMWRRHRGLCNLQNGPNEAFAIVIRLHYRQAIARSHQAVRPRKHHDRNSLAYGA